MSRSSSASGSGGGIPRDIEQLVRSSLATRATDIEPDPELFGRVQQRIRRQRLFRFGAAGLVAAAGLAVVALAAPTLIDRRVEFEPAPVATQPPADGQDGAAAPVPDGFVFTDGSRIIQQALDVDAEVVVVEGEPDPEAPITTVAVHPDSSWSDVLVAYAQAAGCGELHWAAVGGNDEGLTRDGGTVPGPAGTCPTAPIFSPDGHAVAWAAATEGDGTWQLHLASWPQLDDVRSFELPWGAQTLAVMAQAWLSTPQSPGQASDGDIMLTVDSGDDVEVYAVPFNADGGGLPVETDAAIPLGGEDGWSPIAVADAGTTTAAGEPVTYTLDVTFAEGRAIAAVRLARYEGDTRVGVHEPRQQVLPAGEPPASITDHWLSAVGDTVAYGGGAGVWLTAWERDGFAPEEALDEPVVHAQLFVASAHEPPQQPQDAQATVNVFFTHTGGECGEDVRAYGRTVEGPGVLRGALEHLLAGPTSDEQLAGATSVFSDQTAGALRSVTIDEGVARVDFADYSDTVPSTSCATGALLAELDATVTQFPTVERAVYSFDGSVDDFYGTYQLASPEGDAGVPPAVRQTRQRILAALESWHEGDDAPMAALIDRETFSCSFSDQNEDCVALWREQEADGQDPLGPLAQILRDEPARNPDAPIWVWPSQWLTDEEYLGPRTGIHRDGTWRYYQQGGD